MKEKLKEIVTLLQEDLKNCTKEADLLNIKSHYLGKKSELNNYLSNLKNMSPEEKNKMDLY